MTIYKPKQGDKNVEKKSDSPRSKIRIPEDVVRMWFCVTAFVDNFQLKWLPVCSGSGSRLDKISSCIFVTLRYRDEDPIVEQPGAVIIANYASVTIISNQRKTYTCWKTLTLSVRIQKKITLLKICANVYLIDFTNSQQHWPRSNPRPVASHNQSDQGC